MREKVREKPMTELSLLEMILSKMFRFSSSHTKNQETEEEEKDRNEGEEEKDPSFSPTFLPPKTSAFFFSSIFSTDFLDFLLPWHHEAGYIMEQDTSRGEEPESGSEREERKEETERQSAEDAWEKSEWEEKQLVQLQILSLSSLVFSFTFHPTRRRWKKKKGKKKRG